MNLKTELFQYHCSEQYFLHPFYTGVTYTEGVKALAEKAEAYWLLDYLFSYKTVVENSGDRFFPVFLEKTNDGGMIIQIGDSENPIQHKDKIPFTDFPLDNFKLFWAYNGGSLGWTLLLPSEY